MISNYANDARHYFSNNYASNEFWIKKVDSLMREKRNYIKMNSETKKEIL